MAENVEEIESLLITIGIDTDENNKIWSEDFQLDPPETEIWIIFRNIGSDPVQYRLSSKADACFVIMDDNSKRLWSYPDHAEKRPDNFFLQPGERFKKKITTPWGEILLKPNADYLLAGWLNDHPHLSSSITFSLAILE